MGKGVLNPTYRPDIDGLRAIAVLSVVAFHVFPGSIRGGFIGVDVFFVISGYLISTIIFENLAKGTFSLATFYARRVRRIFPALLVVLGACFLCGWAALLSNEYEQLGKHIASGAGFVSNLVLWSEAGYFDNVGETKPLLHLWSLGIEEQFYIVWPVLLWFAWRRQYVVLTISALALLSFALNVSGIGKDAIATFYSPLTRFWELSCGALLSWFSLHRRFQGKFAPGTALYCNIRQESNHWTVRVYSNAASFAGFALLVYGFARIQKDVAFPGWWAVVPVCGTVMMIAAGADAWLNRVLLSNRIVVWLGLISYPLYLWHWPLLSFIRIVEGQKPERWIRFGIVIASILLAWLTYRFVERYIRASRGYRYVFALVVCNAAVALCGAYVYFGHGLADRSAEKDSGLRMVVRQQFMGALWPYTTNQTCLNDHPYAGAERLAWWFCVKSKHGKPTLIILGNSYANQLYPGFIKNPSLAHHNILSIGTCDVAVPKQKREDDPNDPCSGKRGEAQRQFIDQTVAKETSIKFAVIGGVSANPDADYIDRLKARIDEFERRGIRVIVFGPHLMADKHPADYHPNACFPRRFRQSVKDCSFPLEKRHALSERFKPLVERISRSNPKVIFFDQNDIFCPGDKCSFIRDGMPLLRDEYSHTSEYASTELHRYFNAKVARSMPELFNTKLVIN